MATDAQTLVNNATPSGYDKLSDRELGECLLSAVTAGALSQSLLTTATAQGCDRLSDRELKECLLAVALPPAQTAQTLISLAVLEGYEKLSEHELKECILVAASGSGPTLSLTSFPAEMLSWNLTTPANGWWFIVPCGSENLATAFDQIGGSNTSVQTSAPDGTSVWLIGTLADQTTIVVGPSNCVTVLPP